MMLFYYGAKVRSVPEYLWLRFNEGTYAFNAATFVTLGGLTSPIYNEVLQFFIILVSRVPLTIVAGLHAWQGLGSGRIRRASAT